MIKWLEGPSVEEDVVISTRIRLARNIQDYNFPNKLTMDDSDRLTENILNSIKDDIEDNYSFKRIRDMSSRHRRHYVERHLISYNLENSPDKSSFLLRDDEKVNIMINEEDHLRIQTLSPGLNLKKSWENCSDIDDIFGERLRYAYDKDWGYLTSCPTNVGTGLRASVMVHLPCITMTGNMKELISGLNNIGIVTRGIYGEGSGAQGGVYQISNQKTLGKTEEEIIEKLDRIIRQIINRERELRQYLMANAKLDIEDKIYRSYGILKYIRKIDAREAMVHLSNIRMAWELDIIKNARYKELESLMIEIQPANIQRDLEKDINQRQRDILRADIIREFMEKVEG